MPIRKRMSPIASRARSKRRMRPKRRKKPPAKLIWKREEIRNEGGRGGREWEEAGLIWGVLWVLWGFFEGGGAYLPPVQNATPISGGRGLVYYTCCGSSRSIGR